MYIIIVIPDKSETVRLAKTFAISGFVYLGLSQTYLK